MTPEHDQRFTHTYVVHYPEHEPREDDPYRHDFAEWKHRRKITETYYCDFAMEHRAGDFSECDHEHPLEAHHKVIEFAMVNEVDISLLEKDYPGISADTIGKWIDNDANLILLCRNHHRGAMGVHNASAADYGASFYIRSLIKPAHGGV